MKIVTGKSYLRFTDKMDSPRKEISERTLSSLTDKEEGKATKIEFIIRQAIGGNFPYVIQDKKHGIISGYPIYMIELEGVIHEITRTEYEFAWHLLKSGISCVKQVNKLARVERIEKLKQKIKKREKERLERKRRNEKRVSTLMNVSKRIVTDDEIDKINLIISRNADRGMDIESTQKQFYERFMCELGSFQYVSNRAIEVFGYGGKFTGVTLYEQIEKEVYIYLFNIKDNEELSDIYCKIKDKYIKKGMRV